MGFELSLETLLSTMCPSCVQEIAEPLYHLKQAMEQLSASQTFRYILATVLAIGNFLNGCKVSSWLNYVSRTCTIEIEYIRKVHFPLLRLVVLS